MLRVNDVYECIQGEGCMVGTPMVLIRLQGCGVGCPWCDTKETWTTSKTPEASPLGSVLGTNDRWTWISEDDLAEWIHQHHGHAGWVLVTGGEPADQDLRPLVARLKASGWMVALETSGTALGHIGAGFDWITVSPKFDMPGGRIVIPAAVALANEIKHVVGKESDIERLDHFLAEMAKGGDFGKRHVELCLQPVSASPRATELCIKVVKERSWRLSIQTHKIIGER